MDAVGFSQAGRPDIGLYIISELTPILGSSSDQLQTNLLPFASAYGIDLELGERFDFFTEQAEMGGDLNLLPQENYHFIIKEISTSRKEVRIKLFNENILNNTYIIYKLINLLCCKLMIVSS